MEDQVITEQGRKPGIWFGILALVVAGLFIYRAVDPENDPLQYLMSEHPYFSALLFASVFLLGARPWVVKIAISVSILFALLLILGGLPEQYRLLVGFAGFAMLGVYRLVSNQPGRLSSVERTIVGSLCLVIALLAVYAYFQR